MFRYKVAEGGRFSKTVKAVFGECHGIATGYVGASIANWGFMGKKTVVIISFLMLEASCRWL
ncbi:MAG: hypothetical protein WCP97_04975 [bacterium]